MNIQAVTDLQRTLVADTHAEGITNLAAAAVVVDGDRALLIAVHDNDIQTRWKLPTDSVLPGESLVDALDRTVATTTGLEITGDPCYLGHDDEPEPASGQTPSRTFIFATRVADPSKLCRTAIVGHRWVEHDEVDPADPSLGASALVVQQAFGRL
jgi:8-oxo-dGTP diphosphatase